MNYLIVKDNPVAGVTLLEIFEAQYAEGRKMYPVSVDGYYMTLERSGSHGWVKKGMVFGFPPHVITYVIGLIEEQEAKQQPGSLK